MKKLFPAAIAAMLICALAACAPSAGIRGREDILDKRVAVIGGSVAAGIVAHTDPELELVICDSAASLKDALKKGRADCAVADKAAAEELTGFLSGLETAREPYAAPQYAIAVSEDNRLMLERLNAALRELEDSGRLAQLIAGAAGRTPGEGSAVTVAVEPDQYPLSYLDEAGELRGVEIELVRELCAALGLAPQFMTTDADMLLYMAESGKCAFAIGRLTAGEGEGLLYTASYMDATQYIIVKK